MPISEKSGQLLEAGGQEIRRPLDLGYGNPAALQYQAEEVSKLLDAYLNGMLSSVS